MRAILIDAYRAGNKLVLWLKTEDNIRIEISYQPRIYIEDCWLARKFISENNLELRLLGKRDYQGKLKQVYEYAISDISNYESIVRWIEKSTSHQVNLYNADIAPEQMFLYEKNLSPFDMIGLEEDQIIPIRLEAATILSKATLEITGRDSITSIMLDGKEFIGSEEEILRMFAIDFARKDPDVIMLGQAFSKMPFLAARLEHHKIECLLHRWDPKPIRPKGGKSFFSYGKVIYREYAVRLNGRFLIDTGTAIGAECDVEGIMEISQLCSTRFQQVASRSFGAAFQASLVRELVKRKMLVPYKEKPTDPPMSLHNLLKLDRVGHRFDSLTGLHHDVAEIDFSSMYPWIIYNYNISPESFNAGGISEKVPGIDLELSLGKKGLVPSAIKPLLDRRMHYKRNPTLVNKSRVQGLKWVLVTSYGYLRFREFKLGTSMSHMAIGAYAREILLKAKGLFEKNGYRMIHGIVDSLYVNKKDMSEEDVKTICSEIEMMTGIPVSFEGIFKWIIFLPSINDLKRPVPTKYFGVFEDGRLKVRGIEARQESAPPMVRNLQLAAISAMALHSNPFDAFPEACSLLRNTIKKIKEANAYDLACSLRISRTEYKQDNPQARVIMQLKKRGINPRPGQKIKYVYVDSGVVLPEYYFGRPDIKKYRKLLVRSLYSLFQVFGRTKEEIEERIADERQTRLGKDAINAVGFENEKMLNFSSG